MELNNLKNKIFAIFIALVFVSSFVSVQSEPLTIEKAIQIAENSNIQLQTLREKLRLAKAESRLALPIGLPIISIGGGYTYFGELTKVVLPAFIPGQEPSEIEFGSKKNFQGKASIQQPIFASGRYFRIYQSAKHDLAAAEKEFEAGRNSIALDVSKAFYALLVAREFIEVSQESADLADQQLTIAKQRFDAGVVTNFDVLRASVQLANAQTDLIRAKNGELIAINAFKNLLNIDLDQSIEIDGNFDLPSIDLEFDELWEITQINRPEFSQIDLLKRTAQNGIAIAKTATRPSVFAFGNYQIDDNEKLTEINKSWNVGVMINFPIFDGLATQVQVQRARSGVEQIRLQKQQLRDLVEFEVRSAFLNLISAKKLIASQKETVDQAKEGVRLANLQYENGLITSVQLTDAQLALRRTEISNLQALHDYAVSFATLEKAIGRSLK